MRKILAGFSLLPLLILSLCSCQAIGDKSANFSVIYYVTAFLSLVLLILYCVLSKKRDPWFLLLFASVLVVNIGYVVLSISRNLEEALLANRIAYLGSVFLPLSMWMIILNVTNLRYRKWIPGLMLAIGVIVFFVAASPGYLDIYYKEVYFEKINGVTVLNKVYGPLHGLYLIYLLGYFAAMIVSIIHAMLKDKVEFLAYAAVLAIAVFVNIGVWMIEQLVRIDFEMLSLSYIISESFLLGLNLFMAEIEKKKLAIPQAPEIPAPQAEEPVQAADPAKLECFLAGVAQLTPKEKSIYECYIAGMSTSQIMEELNIKENTLKFHNKNIYGKLGVSSRKQLLALYRTVSKEHNN